MMIKHAFFTVKDRMGRHDFAGAWIVLLLINLFIYLLVSGVNIAAKTSPGIAWLLPPLLIVGVTLALISFFCTICITAKRLHDLNYSGWWQLASFVPILNLLWIPVFFILLFKRGNESENRFGHPPVRML